MNKVRKKSCREVGWKDVVWGMFSPEITLLEGLLSRGCMLAQGWEHGSQSSGTWRKDREG